MRTLLLVLAAVSAAAQPKPLAPVDIFQLEAAVDPQISPDGKRIVYVRQFSDIMADQRRSNLWIVNTDGSDHRPLTTGITATTPRAGTATARNCCSRRTGMGRRRSTGGSWTRGRWRS